MEQTKIMDTSESSSTPKKYRATIWSDPIGKIVLYDTDFPHLLEKVFKSTGVIRRKWPSASVEVTYHREDCYWQSISPLEE